MSQRRQRGFATLALWVALTMVSCKPKDAPRGPSGALDQTTPDAEPNDPARPWVQQLVPPKASGSSLLFFDDASRVVVVHASGVRRDVTETRSEVGLDFPTVQIWGMAESDTGVLWKMRDGSVYRSPSATGPMKRVEGLNAGSVAVVGDTGYACTQEGELVSVAMTGIPSVQSQERPCTSVGGTSEALAVEYPSGVWSPQMESEPLGWSSTASAMTPNPRAEPDAVDRADRLISTWRDRRGIVYGLDGAHRAHQAQADGTWAPVPGPRGMSCDFFPSGDALVASCTGARHVASAAHRLFAYRDHWVQTFAGAPGPQRAKIRASVSRIDGSVVLDHACELDRATEARDDTEAFPLCIVAAQRSPRTLRSWSVPTPPIAEEKECDEYADEDEDEDAEYDADCDPYATVEPSPHPSLWGYQHPYLLVQRLGSRVHVLDVRSGKDALPSVQGCQDARWVGPGWLLCRRTERSTDTLVLHRVEDDRARPVALPAGDLTVAFADAHRGLAAGQTAEALWTTTDGGASWDPVELEIDGHLSHLQLQDARCTNVVCSARPFVWADKDVLRRFDLPEVGFVAPQEPARPQQAPR